MALPEWLKEELDRREIAPRGWQSVETLAAGSDASTRTGTLEPLAPPAKPWQAPKRWQR